MKMRGLAIILTISLIAGAVMAKESKGERAARLKAEREAKTRFTEMEELMLIGQ